MTEEEAANWSVNNGCTQIALGAGSQEERGRKCLPHHHNATSELSGLTRGRPPMVKLQTDEHQATANRLGRALTPIEWGEIPDRWS